MNLYSSLFSMLVEKTQLKHCILSQHINTGRFCLDSALVKVSTFVEKRIKKIIENNWMKNGHRQLVFPNPISLIIEWPGLKRTTMII